MNFGESRINELEKAEEFMVEVAIMSNKAFFAINFAFAILSMEDCNFRKRNEVKREIFCVRFLCKRTNKRVFKKKKITNNLTFSSRNM